MIDLPEVLDQEAMDLLTRFFGGTLSAVEQIALAWWWNTHPEARDSWIYQRPIPQAPMWMDIIVGGISIGEALLGLGIEEDPLKVIEGMEFKAKEGLKELGKGLRKFGEGGVLYSVPMLTRTTIVDNIPLPTAAAKGSGPSQPPASRGRVIKL